MPFLRFTRDRRGYENTFLVETVRRRGRERSRVLYWFRSPPQVKVGRAALDEYAIRALEEQYPEIAFDWTRILEARFPPADPSDDHRRGRPRLRGERPERFGDRPVAPVDRQALPVDEASPSDLATDRLHGGVEPPEDLERSEPIVSKPDSMEAASIELPETEPPALATEPSAAARRFGAEGLQRLRGRYAEVCARIAGQVTDPVRLQTLRDMAERLNPDAWVTDAEVTAGLAAFEQVLDGIRREIGPLRHRSRRGGRRKPTPGLRSRNRPL